MGARKNLREHFLRHVGEVLEADDLREVAGGINEWARRIRELRDEDGLNILSHRDRSDLRPGQYILENATFIPTATKRTISKETRALVLDRDGFTCQMCGAVAGEPHSHDGRKTTLHIGHIIDKVYGGTDDPSNLRALCSVCNEGISSISLERSTAEKLMIQIRRAQVSEQEKVLDWIVKKFPKKAEEILRNIND